MITRIIAEKIRLFRVPVVPQKNVDNVIFKTGREESVSIHVSMKI